MDKKFYKGHRERLRKRFSQHLEAINSVFEEYEFLELLLTYAIPQGDVKPLSKELLLRYKSVENVINAPKEGLLSVKGVGEKTYLYLKILAELVKIVSESNLKDERNFNSLVEIHSTEYLVKYLRNEIGHLNQEVFFILFLNSANKIIRKKPIFFGTVDRSAVYPREIIKEILSCEANAVIFSHNHPSGNIMPSKEDIRLTNDMKENLRIINVKLLDHVIITRDSYFSFFEEKLL